jgi:predicted enzyme related to lactoylglutathione lyase
MANIVYFEIPADDIDRAKRFYHSLLGWKIEPTKVPNPEMISMGYQDIITGDPKEVTPMGGTLSSGGIYKRQMNKEPIINYVMVDDIDKMISMVEKLGGKITVPKMEIKYVGQVVIIQDTEGNTIGLYKPMT